MLREYTLSELYKRDERVLSNIFQFFTFSIISLYRITGKISFYKAAFMVTDRIINEICIIS